MIRTAFLLFLPALLAAQTSLSERIGAILTASPDAARAHWGIRVIDTATGATLYEKNANSFFVPASNTKLFSTALALIRLGPDYRMVTRITAQAGPDAQGTVQGDLRLIGGGDTTLSARKIPYTKDEPKGGDPLQAIEALAQELVSKHGVKRITGDIVGDDTAFVWAPFPPGWAQDDATWEYGAPVSALILNDNAFRILVRPGAQPGDPARLTLDPPVHGLVVHNLVRTVKNGSRSIEFRRRAGSRELEVHGQIAASDAGLSELLAVDDPALFAARALFDALERRGVAIAGRPVAQHRDEASVSDLKRGEPIGAASGVELVRRLSPPLVEMLRVVDKVSQNLHAETMLRVVARVRRNVGSREAGLEELKTFLEEAGVAEADYFLRDGSGLSRLNLLTPDTVTKLLLYMARSPRRDDWIGLMPVGSEDGTLNTRFKGSAAAGRVRAKTGTISHVSALSGYLEKPDGTLLAFSIFANNYNGPSSGARSTTDKIVNSLLERD